MTKNRASNQPFGQTVIRGRPPEAAVYQTRHGRMYSGKVEDLIDSGVFRRFENKVQLIFTSPPFPLTRKKRYGNLQGQAYKKWLSGFSRDFVRLLTDTGSIVIEMGNAWEPRKPVMSTLPLESLLAFAEEGGLHLCQEFIWDNPARLPSPAQWVNIERIRVKDSFTRLWWLSKSTKPKANNRNVLQEYSESMQELLMRGDYNSGERPSEHSINERSFLKDNGGSIPSNVLSIANTRSNDAYAVACRENRWKPHPARMPSEIPEFFIKFLTEPGDIVFDPFAGSNTTGASADRLSRYWISVEVDREYAMHSSVRLKSEVKTVALK